MRQAPPSWSERVKNLVGKTKEREREPWFEVLETLRGRIDVDGIERVSTQAIFDILKIPQTRRRPHAHIRLAAVMRELGWNGTRVRDTTRGGYRENVRGYSRPAAEKPRYGAELHAKPHGGRSRAVSDHASAVADELKQEEGSEIPDKG